MYKKDVNVKKIYPPHDAKSFQEYVERKGPGSSRRNVFDDLIDFPSTLLNLTLGILYNFQMKHQTKIAIEPLEENLDPPRTAAYLLRFLPKKVRKNLIGDLFEEYEEVRLEQGKRRADWWFRYQVASSFFPLIKRFALRWSVILGMSKMFLFPLMTVLGGALGNIVSEAVSRFVK